MMFRNTEGYMTISERIFKILEREKMSQREFCRRVGITPSTVSDWKTKKHNPSSDKIMDICEVLNLTPEQLLTGKGIDVDDETEDVELDYQGQQLMVEYCGLKDDARKRLVAYAKALGELDKLEDL